MKPILGHRVIGRLVYFEKNGKNVINYAPNENEDID